MLKKVNSKPPMEKNERRRGRPAGKNRAPLSLAERRARNAQYERERRIETTDAMAQLAEAACCDPKITNAELLATVISRLQRAANRTSTKSIEDLKQINENLESQIAALQSRLGSDSVLQEKTQDNDSYKSSSSSSQSESDSDSASTTDQRPTKYRKTAEENTLHDNAEGVRRSSSQLNSSSDSQNSAISNHQLGKTVPSLEVYQPTSIKNELDYNSSSSSHTNSTQPAFSERRPTTSKNEFYSENSSQSEAHSEQAVSQQEVTVEFQLVPDRGQINTERTVDDQSDITFKNPFTEREKAILEKLGCSDFINFDDHHDENQSTFIWPLEYTEY